MPGEPNLRLSGTQPRFDEKGNAMLSRTEISRALERLGELAVAQNIRVELLLVGGAAMVLLYNARLSTRDLDVVILRPR